MIILVRHAQSEGNKNRDIHQFIPDHRVKLTPHGVTQVRPAMHWHSTDKGILTIHHQAEDAGRQLRSLLKPDDTIQFFTSPYRRTRETTEGILRTLTSDDPTPSPFPRNKIKVFEEPRLREQDFGNFQPCSAEMERMWQERADYGHFFYRIPDGESAADAYDRVSGFNESLWRQFGDEDFPSVCVLVTHGLMTRVFLMKWWVGPNDYVTRSILTWQVPLVCRVFRGPPQRQPLRVHDHEAQREQWQIHPAERATDLVWAEETHCGERDSGYAHCHFEPAHTSQRGQGRIVTHHTCPPMGRLCQWLQSR
jgi:broad specificity phosphatase PhoE